MVPLGLITRRALFGGRLVHYWENSRMCGTHAEELSKRPYRVLTGFRMRWVPVHCSTLPRLKSTEAVAIVDSNTLHLAKTTADSLLYFVGTVRLLNCGKSFFQTSRFHFHMQTFDESSSLNAIIGRVHDGEEQLKRRWKTAKTRCA